MKKAIPIIVALTFLGMGCPFVPKEPPLEMPPGAVPPPIDAGQPEIVQIFPAPADTGLPFPGNVLTKRHRVGGNPCPDPFPPLVLDLPPGAPPFGEVPPVFVPETDAPWLDLPETVPPGEPFTPKFNCNITDRSPHIEAAEVLFRIEGHMGMPVDGVDAELNRQVDSYNLPIEIIPLKIELEIE